MRCACRCLAPRRAPSPPPPHWRHVDEGREPLSLLAVTFTAWRIVAYL